MIPENRYSVPAFSGPMVNPWSMRNDISYQWGPIQLQDPSEGLLYRIWTAVLVSQQEVRLYAAGISEITVFSWPHIILSISLSFDQNGRHCIAFEDALGNSYLYWWDPVPLDYVFFQIPDGHSPRCSLDDARLFNVGNSDVILGYIHADTVKYRQQRDRFLVEYVPTIGDGGPSAEANILYHISMIDVLRVVFIYGLVPVIFDNPLIMKKSIIVQKAPAEVLDVTFDFMHTLSFNDYIVTAAVNITLETGNEDPVDMLVGDPTHTNRAVTQVVQGGNAGDVYKISMSARTFNECIYVVEGLLYVNNSPAETPPEAP